MAAPLEDSAASLRRLPAVHTLLAHEHCVPLIEQYGREQTTNAVRAVLDALRASPATAPAADQSAEAILQQAGAAMARDNESSMRSLYNLTGTVLHTNLGRALLPDAAIAAVVDALRWPMNLEWDIETGKRGDRDSLVEEQLLALTGAEAVTVVNNNAAAVLLLLATLATGKEVIVSRGELVEIGGAFRIPDIMVRAGAILREVGSTNRTHLHDYGNAIGPNTSMLMKVHCSNYAITGFTKAIELDELVPLARAKGIPVAVDLGSGTLVDLERYGLPHETTVRETIEAGADLVTFSGDKLLGGPQCGIIAGRADLIAAIKKHPLKRALRVGKLTLAALEPVLNLYRAPDLLAERLTTLRLLTRPAASMEAIAMQLLPQFQGLLGAEWTVTAEPMNSQIGSGALPVNVLPSYGLVMRAANRQRGNPLGRLEHRLRALPRPVIGRISDDALWLDLRCLEASHVDDFTSQMGQLAA